MANLSKNKRDQMIGILEVLNQQHNDDASIRAFNEIENRWTYWYYKCNTDGCKLNMKAELVHAKYQQRLDGYQTPLEIRGMIKEQVEKLVHERAANDLKMETDLKSQETKLGKQRKTVMVRFGLGEIPAEVYNTTVSSINSQLEGVEIELSRLKQLSSNLSMDVDRIIVTVSELGTLWHTSSFAIQQKKQNLAFPAGVKWDREQDLPRTDVENEALRVIRLLSSAYKDSKNEKAGKSFDFPA